MRPHTSARVLQCLGLAATIALVAACGSNSDQSESAPAPAATSATPAADEASPSAGSDDDATTSPTGGTRGTSSPTDGSDDGDAAASAGLPTDAGDYGDALVEAWSKGDSDAVARYAAPGAANSLKNAEKATGMLRVACEDSMCSYANEQDRQVTLTFDEKKLEAGAAGAVTAATVE